MWYDKRIKSKSNISFVLLFKGRERKESEGEGMKGRDRAGAYAVFFIGGANLTGQIFWRPFCRHRLSLINIPIKH